MAEQAYSDIITARNLSASYQGRLVWQKASFTIGRGQFIGVLGPNGAGKTTLFRLLLGLLPVSGGQLKVFAENPHRGNGRIGYIPQRRLVENDMNLEVLEFVRLGIRGTEWGFSSWREAKEERQQAEQALAAVEGTELAHRPLGVLSGGELQRIFLAQAIVGKPEILLLDEPLANLDVRREVNLVQLIESIVRTQHVTVLLIAHDINPLLPALDRVMYIANGNVATGPPSKVVTSKTLSKLYGAPVEVLRDSRGRVAVLGTEEAVHQHD